MIRKISRRRLLELAGGAALVAPLTTACAMGSMGGANTEADSSAGAVLKSAAKLPEPFSVPLPIPPVLRPEVRAGADHYRITQRAAQVEILPGLKTEIWGYDGKFPGPTIESRSGRTTIVDHRNELTVPTVVHLHGGRTPHQDDGYPTDLVLPTGGWHGKDFDPHAGKISAGRKRYAYPVDQPAATLWYHDHRMDFTGPDVYNGLAGFHIVRDDQEERLPLPTGDRDIPLMITDRSFAEDGSFHYPAKDPSLSNTPGVTPDYVSGVLGDCILVNGAPWPELEVSNVKYRFRILNASNARRYRIALDPPPTQGSSFTQIGSDVGLLGTPLTHDEIQIAQAQRFDVIIDFSNYAVGDKITLINKLADGGPAKIMRFVVARRDRDDSRIPQQLVEYEPLSLAQAKVTREFTFQRGGSERDGMALWTVNGKPFDPNRIDARPQLNSVERWKIRTQNVPHPIHIHLGRFQVASRDGSTPGPYDHGWKDTVDGDNGGNIDVLIKFEGYRGKYVFHCHNLEHEDMAMMDNFEVV
ncbi:MAG: multicopper oxidase family protein [Microlunatus sp.]|nr:multicopper oxidase family protein [Microlunatus sp.]